MSRLLLPSLGLLTAACGSGEPSRAQDGRIYAAVLAEPAEEAADDLGRCGQIADDHTRGECTLVVVQRMADAGRSPPEDGCALVTEEPWSSECWFMAAEHWAKRGEPARAAELCTRAGPFVDDCAQHLWQDDVYALVRRQGSRVLPKRLPRAQALYRTWEPVLGSSSDFSVRFWRRFYEAPFEPERPLDLRACAELPGAHEELCRLAAGRVYVIRLHDRNRHKQPGVPHICDLEPLTTEALGRAQPGMEVMEDPFFDALLAEQQGMLCGGAGLDMSGLVGPEAFAEVVARAAAEGQPVTGQDEAGEAGEGELSPAAGGSPAD